MLKDTVQKQMVQAMKDGNKELKTSLKVLMAELKNKEISKNRELTSDEEIEVVTKLVKQVKETLELTPSTMTEKVESLNKELKLYEGYLPEQMSETEIHDTIERVLDKLGILKTATNKDKGLIMKNLMPIVKGKADGKLVNSILSKYLK